MQENKIIRYVSWNLPLFLGMTRADLLRLPDIPSSDFQKLEGGETIAEEGEPCHRSHIFPIQRRN